MILVIDNHDSFTYNLVQLLAGLAGEVMVRRNDELTMDDIAGLAPERIVLSPGPCAPRDAGVTVEAVRRFGPTIPMLGVCLGHQAIAEAYGGRVVPAPRPVHGKATNVAHGGAGLFHGLPSPVAMISYHSLVVDPGSLPPTLEAIAHTAEPGGAREIQGLRHRSHPVWGVQFHPESVASTGGDRVVGNFLEATR